MSAPWHPLRFSLKFTVSDLTLFAVPFSVLAHRCSLREILAGRPSDLPSSVDPGVDGFVLRACPGPGATGQISTGGGYLSYTMQAYPHYYIDLRSSFAGYQKKFSSKTRGTLLRKVKKLRASCKDGLEFRTFSRPEEMETFHVLARQVSRLTYQERLLDAGLPEDPGFVERLSRAARENRVRGYVLCDGKRPVSYLYCPAEDGVLLYSHLGYDPEYEGLSPGTVLLWLALESLFAEQVFDYLDFTEGAGDQKMLFSTDHIACQTSLIFKRGWRNRLLLGTHRRFNRAVVRGRQLADRLAVTARIRRIIRGI